MRGYCSHPPKNDVRAAWERNAAGSGFRMARLVHSAADGFTNAPASSGRRGGDKGSAPDRVREGMTRTCGNRAMRQAGTAGVEMA